MAANLGFAAPVEKKMAISNVLLQHAFTGVVIFKYFPHPINMGIKESFLKAISSYNVTEHTEIFFVGLKSYYPMSLKGD